MKIERYIFAVACALLRSASPVLSSEAPAASLEPDISGEDPAAVAIESDARGKKPVVEGVYFRGTSSSLSDPRVVSSKAEKKLVVRDDAKSSTSNSSKKPNVREDPAPTASKASKKLTVRVDKATNLGGHDPFGGATDAYVEVKVYESSWRTNDETIGDTKTRVVEDTNDPVFDEDFEFVLPEGPKDIAVQLKVMDKDVSNDDEIGQCEIKLDGLHLGPEPKEVVKTISGDAEIYTTLKLE